MAGVCERPLVAEERTGWRCETLNVGRRKMKTRSECEAAVGLDRAGLWGQGFHCGKEKEEHWEKL